MPLLSISALRELSSSMEALVGDVARGNLRGGGRKGPSAGARRSFIFFRRSEATVVPKVDSSGGKSSPSSLGSAKLIPLLKFEFGKTFKENAKGKTDWLFREHIQLLSQRTYSIERSQWCYNDWFYVLLARRLLLRSKFFQGFGRAAAFPAAITTKKHV